MISHTPLHQELTTSTTVPASSPPNTTRRSRVKDKSMVMMTGSPSTAKITLVDQPASSAISSASRHGKPTRRSVRIHSRRSALVNSSKASPPVNFSSISRLLGYEGLINPGGVKGVPKDDDTVVVGVTEVSEVPPQAEVNKSKQATAPNFFIYTSLPHPCGGATRRILLRIDMHRCFV